MYRRRIVSCVGTDDSPRTTKKKGVHMAYIICVNNEEGGRASQWPRKASATYLLLHCARCYDDVYSIFCSCGQAGRRAADDGHRPRLRANWRSPYGMLEGDHLYLLRDDHVLPPAPKSAPAPSLPALAGGDSSGGSAGGIAAGETIHGDIRRR